MRSALQDFVLRRQEFALDKEVRLDGIDA